MSATPHLLKQLQELRKHRLGGFNIDVGDDLFQWTIWFAGPKGTLYHPGQYKAVMKFPEEFPFKPPEFKILSKIWHPNVYPDGRVCISILHAPGEDEMNTLETAQMRWTPVQSIEKVLISIVSLLGEPDAADAGAPANVDALVMYRKDRKAYEKLCRDNAEQSIKDLPAGYTPPPEQDAAPPVQRQVSAYSEVGSMAYDDDDDGAEEAPRWADELQQIRNMGLGTDKTDEQLLALIDKRKGDVSAVIEGLM